MAGDYPRVSVIVPAYNAANTIGRCVKSLLAMEYPSFEVIVVDDASRDDTRLITSGLPCKFIPLQRNSGPGYARNAGAKLASGEVLAFTDADCEVSKDWLKKIVRNFNDHDIGAVAGPYTGFVGGNSTARFQFYDTLFRQRNVPRYIDSCCTSNFACRKDLFEKAGGFPPKYVNEDMEFGMRLSEMCNIFWDRDNGVLHNFRSSVRNYFFQQVTWSASAARFYLTDRNAKSKRSTWKNSSICADILLTGSLYLSLAALFRTRWSIIPLIALGGLYLCLNIGFMKYVARKESRFFILKAVPLLYVRNTAWIAGIIKALWSYIYSFLPMVSVK